MKTAKALKTINDRIKILDKYLSDTNDDDSPDSRQNRAKATRAKDLFTELLNTFNNYIEFLRSGVNNKDLVDKIGELLSTTMVPLVERNKQMIDSYKQMAVSLLMKSDEIKAKGNLTEEDKKELDYVHSMMIEYDKVKKDTVEYLYEYEEGLEEITNILEMVQEAMEAGRPPSDYFPPEESTPPPAIVVAEESAPPPVEDAPSPPLVETVVDFPASPPIPPAEMYPVYTESVQSSESEPELHKEDDHSEGESGSSPNESSPE